MKMLDILKMEEFPAIKSGDEWVAICNISPLSSQLTSENGFIEFSYTPLQRDDKGGIIILPLNDEVRTGPEYLVEAAHIQPGDVVYLPDSPDMILVTQRAAYPDGEGGWNMSLHYQAPTEDRILTVKSTFLLEKFNEGNSVHG